MANEEQLAILTRGVGAWNEWRRLNPTRSMDLAGAKLPNANLAHANLAQAVLTSADLANVNLAGANLADAKLFHANLTRANLARANLADAYLDDANLVRANLTSANATDANFTGANLEHTNLAYAILVHANFTGANLEHTNLAYAILAHAKLAGAKLAHARLLDTIFVNLDLSLAEGLDSCSHAGPSIIDYRTLLQSSRPLTVPFLRGCGLSDRLIDHLPSLRETGPIQFHSCFISYSTANQDFAERLHADLQNKGVRCWFAPHDMQAGKKIHEQIDHAIRVYDRLLLILSAESMASSWVKTEIARARDKARIQRRTVLFPIRLVPFDDIKTWKQFDADLGDDSAKEIREFFIPDFSAWKDHDRYARAFDSLLKALKSADEQARART